MFVRLRTFDKNYCFEDVIVLHNPAGVLVSELEKLGVLWRMSSQTTKDNVSVIQVS